MSRRQCKVIWLLRYLWLPILALIGLGLTWALPLDRTVIIMSEREPAGVWPRFELHRDQGSTNAVEVRVTDTEPWPFVLLTADGVPATQVGEPIEQANAWTWVWHLDEPEGAGYTLTFFRDCHMGCQVRGQLTVGHPETERPATLPTKLGVVMPNLKRDWHNRSGWAVEVTYARLPHATYWGIDDLAQRVAVHQRAGLHVLVRVEYDQGQTLPPADDFVALAEYLSYVSRLAHDARLAGVYGYIIGSDFNTLEAVSSDMEHPITPSWYARIFNGFGTPPAHTDNVVQTVRQVNPLTRVLVGPVQPWALDLGADIDSNYQAPWLAYMDALVAHIDQAARLRAEAGVAMAGPDGFDIQAPGRPDAQGVDDQAAKEPYLDLFDEDQGWGKAQMGFRVYRDWMAIINAYPSTQGLPVYVISTNTYDRQAGVPPAQNYPRGWLTAALDVINKEPQVHALVWFLDEFPHGSQWDWFSLTLHPGRLVDAAEEFDALLLGGP